jgi:hypothetical protein
MPVLGTYSADQVALIAVGVPISGYAPGTFITVERNEDSFSLSVGSDGDACRSRTKNFSGKITFTLLQSSNSNLLLSALANADERSPLGDSIAPSTIKDLTGTTLVTAEKSWLVKPANVEYSNEITNREWVVETNELNMLIGGN